MGKAGPRSYDLMADRVAKSPRFGAKLALLIGFGSVLVLMAIAGGDSIRVLRRVETSHAELSRTYLAQHRALERIRSALYLSGNVLRDRLLAEDADSAGLATARLRQLRQQMESALDDYSRYASPEEQGLYVSLKNEVGLYWKTLVPILDWPPEEKLARSYTFLREKVSPHQKKLIEVADKIDGVNQQAVDSSDARSVELFDSFRRRAAVVLMVALGVGLALAALSITHILRLEREARLRYEEILQARSQLEKLSAKLVAAQEEERRSISRELHDEVGQSLSALLVDIGNLTAVTPVDNQDARQLLKTARELAESSVNSVRNMALLLRPSMLDDFGLVPALHWQARELSRRTGIQVKVEADGVADELPDEHRTCVYRVVQEALHNSARHAEAHRVHITASQKSGRLMLTVRDDGKGFDTTRARGMGLVGMEERVRHLGGQFQVTSHPGSGTSVYIELPLAPTEDDNK